MSIDVVPFVVKALFRELISYLKVFVRAFQFTGETAHVSRLQDNSDTAGDSSSHSVALILLCDRYEYMIAVLSVFTVVP